MHVLITGAGGFSGRHMVEAAMQAGHDVTAYTGRRPCALVSEGRLAVLPGDLLDDALTFPDEFDAVIHCAASSPEDTRVVDFGRDNDGVTYRLSRLAVQAKCRLFVYLSSLSVYGRIEDSVLTEDYDPQPTQIYGITKLRGEEHLAEITVPSISLRLPAVVGPGAARNWPARLKSTVRAVGAFNLDAPYNNALHVSDLARFCVDLLQVGFRGAHMVNLASDGMTTVRRAVALIRPDVACLDMGTAPSPPFTISISRAKARYGFRPMWIEETLRRYAAE